MGNVHFVHRRRDGPRRLTLYSHDRKSNELENVRSPPDSSGAATEDPDQVPEVSSVIRLQNGMVLYLREINKSVILILRGGEKEK